MNFVRSRGSKGLANPVSARAYPASNNCILYRASYLLERKGDKAGQWGAHYFNVDWIRGFVEMVVRISSRRLHSKAHLFFELYVTIRIVL